MFVEQLTWMVAPHKQENALNVLSLLHHYMDASGGLVRSLAGFDTATRGHLLSLTFWKSWEDLSRFLSSPKSSVLTESQSGNSGATPKLHHFEVIWEWPEEEVDTVSSESYWAIHELSSPAHMVEGLLDTMRQSVPRLGEVPGFICAGLWVDKNNEAHVALATQWSTGSEPDPELPARLLGGGSAFGVSSRAVFRLTVTDPYHVTSVS